LDARLSLDCWWRLIPLKRVAGQDRIVTLGTTSTTWPEAAMKDVKVLVRVNVGVDAASAVLWLASATIALIIYKQYRRDKLALHAS
jgi:hypothetical protein